MTGHCLVLEHLTEKVQVVCSVGLNLILATLCFHKNIMHLYTLNKPV